MGGEEIKPLGCVFPSVQRAGDVRNTENTSSVKCMKNMSHLWLPEGKWRQLSISELILPKWPALYPEIHSPSCISPCSSLSVLLGLDILKVVEAYIPQAPSGLWMWGWRYGLLRLKKLLTLYTKQISFCKVEHKSVFVEQNVKRSYLFPLELISYWDEQSDFSGFKIWS